MILNVFRTSLLGLLRDRGALALTFVLPIVFFTIFAFIFGGRGGSRTPAVNVAVVDQDQSPASKQLIAALQREKGLYIRLAPEAKKGEAEVPYNAQTAEAAVRRGDLPVAVIIPKGFGEAPVALFGGSNVQAVRVTILADSSDPIAPQMVSGLLQKAGMTAMPASMARSGVGQMNRFIQLTPEQQKRMDEAVGYLEQNPDALTGSGEGGASGSLIAYEMKDVLGEKKKSPLIAYYAAGIGVMFLLFSASGAGGVLLEEAENGTLDRVLASRVTMTSLLLGKMLFLTVSGAMQLLVMFVWGWAVFKLELFSHLGGFAVMTACAATAASCFGLMLAAMSRTRAQLGALSTMVILMMSALGGSMVPRFIMPETMQKAGVVTFNYWALEGYLKVFWREEPLVNLAPQVAVLLGAALVFFAVARRVARKWEFV